MLYSKSTGGFYNPAIHGYAVPEDAVEITAAKHAELIEAQSTGKRIVADESGFPILADPPKATAEDVWVRIKADRDRRKSGGFKAHGKWFHSDPDSRIQYLGLKDKARDLLAAGGAMTDKLTILGQSVEWKTLDGSFVNVTAQVAYDIITAAGDLDAQLFTVAEAHKVALQLSQNPATYDYSGGWPKVFGE